MLGVLINTYRNGNRIQKYQDFVKRLLDYQYQKDTIQPDQKKELIMNKIDRRVNHKTFDSQPILVFPAHYDPIFTIGYAQVTCAIGDPRKPKSLVVFPNWTIDDQSKKWTLRTATLPLIIDTTDVDRSYEEMGFHEYDDITVKIYRQRYVYTGEDRQLIRLFHLACQQCRSMIQAQL